MVTTMHRCDECRRADATFEAQARRVKPGKTKETKGTLAPWDTRFLCDDCARRAATSDDPPRRLTRLADPTKSTTAGPENLTFGDAFKGTAP